MGPEADIRGRTPANRDLTLNEDATLSGQTRTTRLRRREFLTLLAGATLYGVAESD